MELVAGLLEVVVIVVGVVGSVEPAPAPLRERLTLTLSSCSSTARKALTRAPRFMVPWKATMGCVAAKPVVKLTTAGADRVPPAPWVKIRDVGVVGWEVGGGSVGCGRGSGCGGRGRERRHGIGGVELALLAGVEVDLVVEPEPEPEQEQE
jgi:hypothetical protein